MLYKPPIKGFLRRSVNKPKEGNLSDSIAGVASTIYELKSMRDDIIKTVDCELEKIYKIVSDTEKSLQSAEAEIEDTKKQALDLIREIKTGEPGRDADEDYIIKKVCAQIRQPKDGHSPDKDEITKEVLKRIPKFDENKLIKKVISSLPEHSADLKIIRESVETDPLSVVDKIMALPDGKFKLKSKHIDGLDQTIRAMQNQLSRGYLHGAGVPSLTEGTGVTLTKKSDGGYVVSATGSADIYTETPTGLINSSNKVFTVVNPINSVITFAINGQYIHKNEYTFTGNTITFVTALDSSLSGKDFDIVYK